jgi:antitoxin component YwqK of YwqJK toxin-antitoxin module
MNKSAIMILSAAIIFTSCNKPSQEDVISKRYIHKYDYDVPETQWFEKKCPGKILTTYRNGKTISESYEDSLLHGEKTISFERSQTIQIREVYKKGTLVKRTNYNSKGIPEEEIIYKSPTHQIITNWYATGSPKSKEEFKDNKLINGTYFSIANETDSCITNGNGEKTNRNSSGDILSKEVFSNFEIAYIETYHPNKTPHTIKSYDKGYLHGEVKEFTLSGEPLIVENYKHGQRHGISTRYQNGYKYQETTYYEGLKNGIEKFYIDGESLTEETLYKLGLKHGPSVTFYDDSGTTCWYFNNQKVSKDTFDQYEERDMMITSVQ